MTSKEMIRQLEMQREWGDACLADPEAIITAIEAGQEMYEILDQIEIFRAFDMGVRIKQALTKWKQATKAEEL